MTLRQSRQGTGVTVSAPEVVKLPSSISRRTDLYRDPAFRIAWENDVKFHVTRHLLLLRKFRRWSQGKVAHLAGTSQSAVARIEAGEENVSVETIERLVNALDGCFDVSIAPKEMHFPRWQPWWELLDGGITATTPFTRKAIVAHDDGSTLRVLAGWITRYGQVADASTTPVRLVGAQQQNG